jgi:hypothetical protein
MKHNKPTQTQKQRPARMLQPAAVEALNQGAIDSVPSPDEVARAAYLKYLNQGSLPGHDVQHWLEAEAHLLAQRNHTRVHGFPNQA